MEKKICLVTGIKTGTHFALVLICKSENVHGFIYEQEITSDKIRTLDPIKCLHSRMISGQEFHESVMDSYRKQPKKRVEAVSKMKEEFEIKEKTSKAQSIIIQIHPKEYTVDTMINNGYTVFSTIRHPYLTCLSVIDNYWSMTGSEIESLILDYCIGCKKLWTRNEVKLIRVDPGKIQIPINMSPLELNKEMIGMKKTNTIVNNTLYERGKAKTFNSISLFPLPDKIKEAKAKFITTGKMSTEPTPILNRLLDIIYSTNLLNIYDRRCRLIETRNEAI